MGPIFLFSWSFNRCMFDRSHHLRPSTIVFIRSFHHSKILSWITTSKLRRREITSNNGNSFKEVAHTYVAIARMCNTRTPWYAIQRYASTHARWSMSKGIRFNRTCNMFPTWRQSYLHASLWIKYYAQYYIYIYIQLFTLIFGQLNI